MDSISTINENVIKNVISKFNIESYYKYKKYLIKDLYLFILDKILEKIYIEN